MIFKHFFFSFCVLSTASFVSSMRQDIHHMMYQNFESPASCFRRLNGTHQFGCSSPRSGSYGVIHLINSTEDLEWLKNKAVAGPYMVALKPEIFSSEIIDSLASMDHVSGILVVLNRGDRPSQYSPDNVCPNKYSGEETCDTNAPWNPLGNNFLLRDWNIPIFIVNKPDTIHTIIDCHNNFNYPLDDSQLSRSLCSLHLKAHMYAAVDSETCLRRTDLVSFNPLKYCDPMGDQNVFLSVGDFEKRKPRSVIVIAARLDTASLFDGLAPGAMSSVTGVVTLITLANILYNVTAETKISTGKSVVFMLLNGEAFDYIGSSKVVYDMKQGLYPSANVSFTLDEVLLFLEISQLDMDNKIYMHFPKKDETVNNFIGDLQNVGRDYGIDFIEHLSSNLPPSSFQTFHKADNNMSGLVLANHEQQYKNKYYNGIFDTAENLNYIYANGSKIGNNTIQSNLAAIATSLASALFKILTENKKFSVHGSYSSFVDEMLYCYLENSGCKIMQAVINGEDNDIFRSSLPLYVGVVNSINRITKITGLILESVASPKLALNATDCAAFQKTTHSPIFSYAWAHDIDGSEVCIKTTLTFSQAVSPAFQIKDYDWSSGEYPSWTESVWTEISLRMFLKPSRTQEYVTLFSGLLVMAISFVVAYCFSSKGQELFPTPCPVNC